MVADNTFYLFEPQDTFSLLSTRAYQAPPTRVNPIPIALVPVMVRLNMPTAKRIVNACFTFADQTKTHSHIRIDTPLRNCKRRQTSNGHPHSSDLLICGEADNVQPKRDRAVTCKRKCLFAVHFASPYTRELACQMRVDDALDESQRGHA
jgi:hypothetical protein